MINSYKSSIKRSSLFIDRYSKHVFYFGILISFAWQVLFWRKNRIKSQAGFADHMHFPEFQSFPKVSVLVAAWNESSMIERHIRSVLSLRYPALEYILCAGGQDDTYHLALRFADKNVRILRQDRGEGKQQALRRCLEQASGTIIYLTDADCIVNDYCFEHIIAPIANGLEQVVTGALRPLPEQVCNPIVEYRWAIDYSVLSQLPAYVDQLRGCNHAIDRSLLEHLGGFSSEAPIGTDYNLAKRLWLHKVQILYVPQARVECEYYSIFGDYKKNRSREFRNVVVHNKVNPNWVHLRSVLLSLAYSSAVIFVPFMALILRSRMLIVIWGIVLGNAIIRSWQRIQLIRSFSDRFSLSHKLFDLRSTLMVIFDYTVPLIAVWDMIWQKDKW